MLRKSLYLIAMALGGLLLTVPALAEDGIVAIGGETLFVIHAAAQGRSATERADDVTGRLPDILGDSSLTAEDITIVPNQDGTASIMVKNHLLITATPEDGKPNGRTAQQQAEVWAVQARKVILATNSHPNPIQIRSAPQVIRGTVTYRERIALPPDASLSILLNDVSAASTDRNMVTKVITPHQQVPIPFTLPYTLRLINPKHHYAVTAVIRIGGKVRWISLHGYPVITYGHPRQVAILLHQVAGH